MRSRFVNEKRWFDGVALVLCMVALGFGIGATHDLAWPFDADLIRDVGHAQSIASGDLLADPQFKDEGQWYNPLIPGLVGGLARMTGLEVSLLYARLGSYVNTFGSLAFYGLLVVLMGRRVALLGLVAYLFLDPVRVPAPYAASYTPWLYSLYGTQALFYGGLASFAIALRRGSMRWHLVSGAFLGGTFLGHSFPAVLLGLLFLASALGGIVRAKEDRWSSTRRFGAAVAVAFVCALPFLVTILFRYRLEVVNPAPTAWIYPPMRDALAYLTRYAGPSAVVSVLGLGVLIARRAQVEAKLLLGWTAIVGLWIGYVSLWWWAKQNGHEPPAVTFSMHVNFYFGVLLAVLFGVGAEASLGKLAGLVRPESPRSRGVAVVLCALTLALVSLPSYGERPYFAKARELSQRLEKQVDGFGAYDWIRANTDPGDVFLSSDHHAMFTVLAAGRKIVATFSMHSNPYVDVGQRRADRKRMFDALGHGSWDELFELCERYDVSYVIMNGNVPALQRAPRGAFTTVLTSKFGVIVRVARPEQKR